MSTLARTDMSLLGQWWWTVDRWSLGALLALIMFGVLMIFAASPAVAVRLNLDSFHFVQRHFIVVPLGLLIIVLTSPQAALEFLDLSTGVTMILSVSLIILTKGGKLFFNSPFFPLIVTVFSTISAKTPSGNNTGCFPTLDIINKPYTKLHHQYLNLWQKN